MLLPALLVPAPAAGAGQARVVRAVWVARDALASRAETRRAVLECARIGCSLVFLQVSGRWDAYFRSRVFPQGQFFPPTEEGNLSYAVALAHRHGIRVHAWVNALLAWAAPDPPRDPAHVFHVHPEWFLVGADGLSIARLSRAELDRRRLDGYFLEPCMPEVRTELRRFVLDLVTRYSLDGIHLDYVRFPSAAWGFQPELRDRYRSEAGLDPVDLYLRGRELGAEHGAAWLAAERARWQAWHRACVTRLVRLVHADLEAVALHLELSAAVLANPESARDDFGQDWAGWLEEGILDAAAPMLYRSSASEVLDLLQRIARFVPPEARLYAGISLQFLAAGEIPPIEALMGRYGADGLAIFSYDLLRTDGRSRELLDRSRVFMSRPPGPRAGSRSPRPRRSRRAWCRRKRPFPSALAR